MEANMGMALTNIRSFWLAGVSLVGLGVLVACTTDDNLWRWDDRKSALLPPV